MTCSVTSFATREFHPRRRFVPFRPGVFDILLFTEENRVSWRCKREVFLPEKLQLFISKIAILVECRWSCDVPPSSSSPSPTSDVTI
jgi:hypothetical protein